MIHGNVSWFQLVGFVFVFVCFALFLFVLSCPAFQPKGSLAGCVFLFGFGVLGFLFIFLFFLKDFGFFYVDKNGICNDIGKTVTYTFKTRGQNERVLDVQLCYHKSI